MRKIIKECSKTFAGLFCQKCTFFLVLLICSGTLSAQTSFQVNGVVVDRNGDPLTGVNVIERGTKDATITDVEGKFSLKVSSNQALLFVSFIGMEKKNVPLDGKNNLTIQLTEDTNIMDDAVVIGYGTVKKSDLTGSVSSIRAEEMQDRMVLSVEDALRGRVAGVSISSSDGQPGESINLRIRGTGSINASNAPLYVIDGVPMEEADINPGDVQSLEILKDASATAIYGSRGANGVVLISTKKGQKGKPRINIISNIGFQTPVRLIDMMDGWQYAEHRYRQNRAVVQRSGDNTVDETKFIGYYDRYGNIWKYQFANPYASWQDYLEPGATNTDWQKVMLRNTYINDTRLNISGGGEQSTYSIMGNYFKNEGMVINSSFEKYSIRANFDQKVTNTLKMGVNMSANKSYQNGTMTNDVTGTTMNMLGQMPIKLPNFTDEYIPVDGESTVTNNNPWYQAMNVVRDTYKDNVLMKLDFDWEFMKYLRLNVSGSYNIATTTLEQFTPKSVNAGRNSRGSVRNNRNTNYNWLNENLLYYAPKAWGIHKFDALAGVTFQEIAIKRIDVEGQNIKYEGLKQNGMNDALTPLNTFYDYYTTRLASFLGRANYTLDGKYMFTVSIRSDGSSRFGQNNKWATFPSGAFAWRMGEEEFVKNATWISNLKMRLSAGVSGNTGIPAYQTLSQLDVSNYPIDGSAESINYGVQSSGVANPDLRWETSTQYDGGVDFGFLNNRITGSLDVYYKQTRDLLMVEAVPAFTGFTSRWSNVGAIDNKGLEITLNGNILRDTPFKWNASCNIAFNRSSVRNLGEKEEMILTASGPVAQNFVLLRKGLPIGTWYGYQTDGLFRTFQEIDALPDDYVSFANSKVQIEPGKQRYVDQNGDHIINEDDRVVLGSAEPKFTGGLQNDFSYKGLGLMVNLEFSYGRDVFNATALNLERSVQSDNQTARYWENRWTPTLYDMNTGEMVWQGNEDNSWLPGNSFGGGAENYCKDLYIEDGSFLRISDVTFSYDFTKKALKRVKISELKLFASVKNLWVFTKYTGYDPDVNTISGSMSDLLPGVDNGAYPRSRVYNIGLNITF